MNFEPVYLPEDRRPNGRASMTLLKHFNACPRSGYLYALHKGEASTVEMQRGRAFHMICERAIRLMVEMGEPMVPPDVVKAIADEVLGEAPVPLEEHDRIREMAYRWADEITVDPSAVVACETLFTMRLGDYDVRCRIDFAQLLDDGAGVLVRDWKSSRAAPSYEEISRKRSDGTLAARSFQLVMYSLALVCGLPVREEEVDGEVVETPEPFPVASRAQHLHLEYVYPGIEDREGKMLRRPVTLTRSELESYRHSAEALLARLAESERTGDWPAVVSDAACGECPASSQCPIPEALRDHRGAIESVEQAADVLAGVDVVRSEATKLVAAVRAFANEHGAPIRYGADRVAAFTSQTRTEVDRDALFAAVDRAVRLGEPFDRDEFVKVSQSTPFQLRKLTAEEMEARDGGNGAGDLDERFGDVPF